MSRDKDRAGGKIPARERRCRCGGNQGLTGPNLRRAAAEVGRRCEGSYELVPNLSHSLLQLELVVRPVFLVEVRVDLVRKRVEFFRPSRQH